jgi:hypothetical protein
MIVKVKGFNITDGSEIPAEEEGIFRVKDLIEELQKYNPQAIIATSYDGTYLGIKRIIATKIKGFVCSTKNVSYRFNLEKEKKHERHFVEKEVDPKEATAVYISAFLEESLN